MDNAFDPKSILIAIQLAISSLCFINSYFLSEIQTAEEKLSYEQMIQPCFGLLLGGLEVITILQLFNWFK